MVLLKKTALPTADQLVRWLAERLPDPGDDVPICYQRGAERPIRRLALALDPADAVAVEADALFLHRPFGFEPRPELTVLASHGGFDRHLTTGFNRPLADALGLNYLQPVTRDGRPIGMTGELAEPSVWPDLIARLDVLFGGIEATILPRTPTVRRIAVMSAMTAALVESAVADGVEAYLTGQIRAPGRAAAERLGLGVVAIGHRRSEAWGLGQLARELAAAFPGLEVSVLGRRTVWRRSAL